MKEKYSDYKKVRKFVNVINDLMSTPKTMQDVYLAVTNKKHRHDRAITWLDEKDKKESIKYKDYRSKAFETVSRLSQRLSELTQMTVVALKVKNNPQWPFLF